MKARLYAPEESNVPRFGIYGYSGALTRRLPGVRIL